MQKNDIYRNTVAGFCDPGEDWQGLCIIRSCEDGKVTFSVAPDDQPLLDKDIVHFNKSTFTMSESDFLTFCEPCPVFLPLA